MLSGNRILGIWIKEVYLEKSMEIFQNPKCFWSQTFQISGAQPELTLMELPGSSLAIFYCTTLT
jgi:hypothetical protein